MALCLGYMAGTLSGVVSRAAGGGGVERKNSQQLVEKGRAVYVANCARCHGGDGLGQTRVGEMVEAPNLTNARWQARRSDSRIKGSIARGRGQMPAFSKKLSRDEVAAVIAYVRTLKN
ncbi:MAG: cytochrome c [Acidobacteria bacterium]|nr:cytochrome c [Acidobacteriota bacterium]